jgi:acetyltransferase-like isoleucine patch superfamily enzyme
MIIPPARVEAPGCIHLGDGVLLHEHSWLCVKPRPGLPRPRLVIGSGTSINRFAKIVCTSEVVIGEDCLMGDQVYIADTHYPPGPGADPIGRRELADPRPVRIGRGSYIGVRAMIEPGVTLGQNVYVGAGAVVREDVDDLTVVVGSPARPVRRYDRDREEWVAVD